MDKENRKKRRGGKKEGKEEKKEFPNAKSDWNEQ